MNLALGRKGLMKKSWTSQERVRLPENSKEVGEVVLSRRFCLLAMTRSSTPKEKLFTIKEQGWGHTELGAGLVPFPGNRAGT